jgi:hypothetical protein
MRLVLFIYEEGKVTNLKTHYCFLSILFVPLDENLIH